MDSVTRLRLAEGMVGWQRLAIHPALRDGLLAALSGVLYAAASPGLGLWPLGLVCWVPLLVALRNCTGRQAAALGLVQGLVSSLLATSWILHAVKALSGWGWAPSLLASSLLWLYQSGRVAGLAWLTARAVRRGWPLGLAFGLSLAAAEVAYPMLFGWQSAIQVHDVPLLMQGAELGGPILISVALAAANVAIAELVSARLAGRLPSLFRFVPAALLPFLLVVYGIVRIPFIEKQVEQAGKGKIGIVQGNLGLRGVRAARSMKVHRDATQEMALRERLDLVVWPETAVHAVYEAKELGRELPASVYADDSAGRMPPVLTGVNVRQDEVPGTPGVPSNSAVLLAPQAGALGRYDKNHLVPFGEYVPLGNVWPALYRFFPSSGPVTPGTTAAPLPLGEHRIGVVICYEDILPAYTNKLMREGAPDLLVNLTNDGWFGRTGAAELHFALSKFRAVEHRRFFVRAGNTGMSAIIDPVGRVLRRSPSYRAATVIGDVAWMRGRTLYEALGDTPWWLCLLVVLAMGLIPARRLMPIPKTI